MTDPGLERIVSVPDFEAPARAALDPAVWDYVASGAGDGTSAADATAAWRRQRLLPHAMVDVSALSTATTLLGLELAHPILLAPTATHARYHPDGELETLRGAAAAGSVLTVATLASRDVTEIGAEAAALDSPWWMQVYLQEDRAATYAVLDRAVAAGAAALVLTVDTPTIGARDRDRRGATGAAVGVTYPNLAPVAPDLTTPDHRRVWNPHLARTVTPVDITALAERYPVPVIAKGILRADDAQRAVDAGAAGLIVSNHGGRNLETAIATAEALGPVVDAIAGSVPVLVDGGLRRGTDIATALCLGADAVLVGRPVVWGLAAYGALGVQRMVDVLRTELEMAMALLGAPAIADLSRDLLAR